MQDQLSFEVTPPPRPEFSFTVDGAPVPKERPRMVKRRGKPLPGEQPYRAMTPPRTRAYEQQVARATREAVPLGWLESDSTFGVELHIYRARRSGDTDNFVKSALDGMNGIAWHDDESVVEIHAYRYDDKANPRVDIWVSKISTEVATAPRAS